MNIKHFQDYTLMSSYASQIVVDVIKQKPNSILSVATGKSTLGLYKELVKHHKANLDLFSKIQVVKLDEWLTGPDNNNEGICEKYVLKQIVTPLNISSDRYISFNSSTNNPTVECERIYKKIKKIGPIDISILGLGKNGHLGFIEPGNYLNTKPYVSKLSFESKNHEMVSNNINNYKFGMTLSINEILSSKKIIILISGGGKEIAKADLLKGLVTTNCPASFLWLHENIDCLILD